MNDNKGEIPVSHTRTLPTGETVYLAENGPSTLMVTRAGISTSYLGPISKFNVDNWDAYPTSQTHLLDLSVRGYISEGGAKVNVVSVKTIKDRECVFLAWKEPHTKAVSASGKGLSERSRLRVCICVCLCACCVSMRVCMCFVCSCA